MTLIRRTLALAAGVTGLLTFFATTANAFHIIGNHCEPLCSPPGRGTASATGD